MRWIVIPDIHQQIDAVDALLDKEAKNFDRILFMGDYFDTYDKDTSATAIETAQWLVGKIVDRGARVLIGNHDMQYLFSSYNFRCSGWQGEEVRNLIRDIICRGENRLTDKHGFCGDVRHTFKLYTKIGCWLISHAGLHPNFLPPTGYSDEWMEKECGNALANAYAGLTHPLLEAGYDRGGRAPNGGITWNDWNNFTPIEGVNQIVGHTCRPMEPRFKYDYNSFNHCIDTDGCHAAIITDTSEDPNDIQIISWMSYPLQRKF